MGRRRGKQEQQFWDGDSEQHPDPLEAIPTSQPCQPGSAGTQGIRELSSGFLSRGGQDCANQSGLSLSLPVAPAGTAGRQLKADVSL